MTVFPGPSRLTVHLLIEEGEGQTWYDIYWTEQRAQQEVIRRMRRLIEAERTARDTTQSDHLRLSRIETMIAGREPFVDICHRWHEYMDHNSRFDIIAQDLVME